MQPGDVTKDGGSSKGGCVMLDDGSSIEYDWLVLALGAEPNTRNVPGVKDYTIPFSTFEDAEKVKKQKHEKRSSEAIMTECKLCE